MTEIIRLEHAAGRLGVQVQTLRRWIRLGLVPALSLGQRFRRLSAKHVGLAVFVAERNDGRSWKKVRAEWIATHTELSHPQDLSNFTRDCRQAYRRVMGRNLRWAGGRTRTESDR